MVKYFTDKHGYPDLTSLIIGKSSGEVGDGFHGDPNKVRIDVYAFDWSKATTDFDGFVVCTVKQLNNKAKPKPKPKKAEAEHLMYEYYKLHKATLPTGISKKRDVIARLIMDGVVTEDAFSQVAVKK